MLAGFLSIGLMSALAWVASRRAGRWYVGTVIFLAGLWALLLTFSRAALLGLGVGAFAILPHLWRLRGRAGMAQLVVTGILAAVVVGMFVAVYWPFVFARAGGSGGESIEMRSVSDRAVYNTLAIHAIHESPVLGVGIGNFPWIASYYLAQTNFDLDGQPAHHVMLSAWAELGLVGLGLTAIMLTTGVLAALRAVRRESPADETARVVKVAVMEGGEAPLRPYSTTSPEFSTLPEAGDDERLARLILLGAVLSLMVTGLLDHYTWTILHFQAAWWAMLGAAGRS
jgi:O-antigen ligase